MGEDGCLHSLGLIDLITNTEKAASEEFGAAITLVRKDALGDLSHFFTVRTLADYANQLRREAPARSSASARMSPTRGTAIDSDSAGLDKKTTCSSPTSTQTPRHVVGLCQSPACVPLNRSLPWVRAAAPARSVGRIRASLRTAPPYPIGHQP